MSRLPAEALRASVQGGEAVALSPQGWAKVGTATGCALLGIFFRSHGFAAPAAILAVAAGRNAASAQLLASAASSATEYKIRVAKGGNDQADVWLYSPETSAAGARASVWGVFGWQPLDAPQAVAEADIPADAVEFSLKKS